MGERETGERDGLPVGWGWCDRVADDGYAVLRSTVADMRQVVAYPSGHWFDFVGGTHGPATQRPGESLLAAAQREAQAALWACDGFGVGEVRGARFGVEHFKLIRRAARNAGKDYALPGLPGLWSIMSWREGNPITVNAVRVDEEVDARPAGEVAPASDLDRLLAYGPGRPPTAKEVAIVAGALRTIETAYPGALTGKPIAIPESEGTGASDVKPACESYWHSGPDGDGLVSRCPGCDWVRAQPPEVRARYPFAATVASDVEPAPAAGGEETGDADELARLLPGLAADIAGLLEFNMSAPMYRLARAAELLTRERERLTKRVAELEAAGRVTASLAKDFAAQAAAEQSVRNWLRAHGHDLTRPWDEVVIGLLEAPPAGSVAGLDHLIRVIVSDARDWSTNRTDAWIYGTIVGWGDALSEVAERNGWSEETTRRLESAAAILRSALAPSPMGARDLYVPSEEHRMTEPLCAALAHGGATKDEAASDVLAPAEIEAIAARDKAYGEGEHEPPQDIAIDRARLLRHLSATGGTVVAEVVAMLPRLRDERGEPGTVEDARKDIARELAEAPVGRCGFTVIAGLAIQGVLACDAKGGA